MRRFVFGANLIILDANEIQEFLDVSVGLLSCSDISDERVRVYIGGLILADTVWAAVAVK
jgi:hypothetical protein